MKEAASVFAMVVASGAGLGPCSERVASDVDDAGATANVARASSAASEEPTPAPVASSASESAKVALGDYACTHDYWVGSGVARRRQSDPVGAITFVDGTTYRWLDSGTGHYQIAASGVITWSDGPLAAKMPRRTTYRKNVKTTQVDVVLGDGVEWSCGHDL